jgi:hypothetical protein
MDLRLPLHVIARQHGLVVSERDLEAALATGRRPTLYRIEDGPRATILHGGGSFTSDAPCVTPSWSQGWGSAFPYSARPISRVDDRARRGPPAPYARGCRGRGVEGRGEPGETA